MTETSPGRSVLVLAASISPIRGSEFSVGWNYVEHMSREHRLTVLYGIAGNHLGDLSEMRDVVGNQFENPVTFVPVPLGRLASAINWLNRRGFASYAFYIAYRLWHRDALRAARKILAERDIDIVHYLCPIGYREPGYLWKLDRPYIWGPIGGMNMRPVRPFLDLGKAAGIKTALRNLVNFLQFRMNPRLSYAIRRADVLVVNTTENQLLVERVYHRTGDLMPENAVVGAPEEHLLQPATEPLRLIWAGRIDTAKALDILIAALAKLPSRGWALDVLGDGPRRELVRQASVDLGLDANIRWHGKVDTTEVIRHFRSADVHVLTSLAEAHSTVLWEAMSCGTPTISFDHCGMHDSICDECGIRLPVSNVPEMELALSQAIARLIDDRATVASLSRGASVCAKRNSWPARVAQWNHLYAKAEAAWSSRARRGATSTAR